VLHANAALTPRQRARLGRAVVDDGWSIATAARFYRVSWPTAAKWAQRYALMGRAGMDDRSSRPVSSPTRTPRRVESKIVHARIKRRVGPVEIASIVGVPASTVHAVLTRRGLNRLSHVDVVTGEPARRYEHPHPGAMIHVDVKKLGNIPDGGGWRTVGRAQGRKNRFATAGTTSNAYRNPKLGHAFVHTVIDDHSRVAYAEIHDDEKADTAIGVLMRAVAWFAARGVRVESVLSDNGSCYRSHAWRDTCRALGIKHRRTRPYRPQTNGKIERFHRTLADGWAYSKHYNSEHARRAELESWMHYYNHHRNHSAIGKIPPINRLNNLPGHYS